MAKDVDLGGGITIYDGQLTIKKDSQILIEDGSTIEVKGTDAHPFYIQKVQNIAPVAVHIKEVNNIDPISVESLYVSQVRNIEPLRIDKLNVTSLPMVNMALRQIPPVNLSIRDLPAISVGTHQVFDLPSDYVVRARLLGFEVLRVHLSGSTRIAPSERFRREQERADNRSFPTVATAGNPAIPSIRKEKDATCTGAMPCQAQEGRPGIRVGHGASLRPGVRSGVSVTVPQGPSAFSAGPRR
jgi:hypothetical protein